MIWPLYGKWCDIKLFSYVCNTYLIQGRKNRVTKSSQFRVRSLTPFSMADCANVKEDELVKAGLWETENER